LTIFQNVEIVKSLIIKRSIVLEHQRTNVSLENAFWNALRHIAQERRESLSHLVASISANRQSANLSSAIRLYVLWYYKDKAARQRALFEQGARRVASPSVVPRESLAPCSKAWDRSPGPGRTIEEMVARGC
jgi:predicted DNA-binding ribbon-helix-helix protein